MHGLILQDRNRDTKNILTERLSNDSASRAGIAHNYVGIYFSEMSPSEMEQFVRYNATGLPRGSP